MTLNVLHVSSEKTWRGGERQLWLQMKHSSDEIRNHVVCPKHSQLAERTEFSSERLHYAPLRNGLDIASAWKIKSLCERFEIDVLHCHTSKAHAVGAISCVLGNKARLVATKRTIFPIKPNVFSRWKYKAAERVICVSTAVKEVVLTAVPSARCTVIPSGIEPAVVSRNGGIYERYPELQAKSIIGYVAALTNEKNPDVFLEVASRVLSKLPNAVMMWIGEGALRTHVEDRIQELQLEERILMPGFQRDILKWIADLDILFFPSLSEGFPTTVLDAMQCGVPVVASHVGGIADMITDGESGRLLAPEDVQGFEEAILGLLENSQLREQVIERAQKGLDRYYFPNPAKQIEEVYRAITIA